MAQPPDDRPLVDRARDGDKDAERQLFNDFVARLILLARKQISQRFASRIDPEDIVQSVFRTFFGRLKEGQFQFEDENDLFKLLVRITVHKTLRQISYHRAAKRSPAHEQHANEAGDDSVLGLLAREPSPEVTVAFLDQLENFLAKLRPDDRKVLELRLQGHGTEEIAEKLATYERKVRRILEHIRKMAEQEGITAG